MACVVIDEGLSAGEAVVMTLALLQTGAERSAVLSQELCATHRQRFTSTRKAIEEAASGFIGGR
jgi:hypothetical protein